MGAKGGNAPTGLKQVKARTVFLRAPYQDWAALSQGNKTEFRVLPRGVPSQWIDTPTPVVLYSVTPEMAHCSQRLMVVTHHFKERLSDISLSPASIAREGFDTYDEFRRYWRARTRRPYRPLDPVEVFRLRQWHYEDDTRLGARLISRLYGEYMPKNDND